jgi:Ca2+-transporting ATPase
MEKAPAQKGLSTDEAETLLEKFGPNEIKETNKVSPLKILFRQVRKNFIIYLLVAAIIISLLVGKQITAYTISVVVLMVIVIGFLQEYRAEKAVASLKNMLMPISIAIRDGKETEVPSSELVPGDIVVLGNGERIPADCEILEEKELRVDESVLTGESKDIRKTTNPEDEEGQLSMGTFIVNGRCLARVVHTGMNTKFGKIANMISTAEKELPLETKINNIAKYMVVIAITVSVLTGLFMFFQADTLNSETITGILILIIALSVSAFPEGFPVVLITTLASGAAKMAKQNAIVNRMSIIETLGETTVICTDKTGTLTQGEMTIRTVYIDKKEIEVTGSGYEGKGEFLYNSEPVVPTSDSSQSTQQLLRAAVICNDTRIERTGVDMEYKVLGTPTEGALLVMAAKAEVFKESIEGNRIEEMPFSSDRKMMSVLFKEKDKNTCFAKGAPEVLLQKCSQILQNGKVEKLTEKERKEMLDLNKTANDKAYRTLALAYKDAPLNDKSYKEEDFVLLGIVAMEDPPREEAAEAIEISQRAGVIVKMITGDNRDTAVSISKQVGLGGNVLLGSEIDQLSDSELSAKIAETTVFARVRPEHKLRIVRALKNSGEIVTMTGDGVNDAPALKEAHIGVAMGKNGTDVSRSVADLTLKDDNFATIVVAIKEGRSIFNNIRKFVSYQLSCNLSELTILFFGVLLSPLLGWEVPLLLALHILFMNLITDNLPAITLGFNPTSKDIMKDKPRKKAQILSKKLIALVLFNGGLMASFTLFAYFFSFNILEKDVETSRTIALVTLIMLEISSAFNFRSFRYSVLGRSLFVNKYLVFASLGSFIATLIVLYTPVRVVFETVPLGLLEWIIPLYAGATIIIIYDLLKMYSNEENTLLADLT